MNGTTTNKWQIYIIVCTIAAMAIGCVVTVCAMSYYGKEVPKDLSMITTGLLGALTSMLVKTSPTETQKQSPTPPIIPNGATPTPVAVVSSEQNPVHTEEAPKEKVASDPTT
jgi:hypothetical protein